MRYNLISIKANFNGDYGIQLFQFEDNYQEYALLGFTWSQDSLILDLAWTQFVFWRGYD